jgi:hypothetical protein
MITSVVMRQRDRDAEFTSREGEIKCENRGTV